MISIYVAHINSDFHFKLSLGISDPKKTESTKVKGTFIVIQDVQPGGSHSSSLCSKDKGQTICKYLTSIKKEKE